MGWRQRLQSQKGHLSPRWEVVSGPITGAIFIPLSQSSCFVLAGSIRSGIVGSVLPCPRQQAIQAFLTGARHMAPDSPSGSRSSRLRNTCGLARCQFFGGGTHMTTKKLSLTVCDSVCVFMQMKFMTLFVAVGWQKALALGSFSNTTCNKKKFSPFVLQGQYLSFRQDLKSAWAPCVVVFTTERSLN